MGLPDGRERRLHRHRRLDLAGAVPSADRDRGRRHADPEEAGVVAAVTSVRAGRVGATKHEIGDRFRGRLFRVYIPVALFTFITLFPFYWMAITSIKSNSELLDHTKNPLF